jgi:Chromosome segregation ATPases
VDLTTALETLEEAIRKIDRETRGRFKDTFDRVNAGVQALYPRLFGGGHAYLELTGEDLLDTGVTIMARRRASACPASRCCPAARRR